MTDLSKEQPRVRDTVKLVSKYLGVEPHRVWEWFLDFSLARDYPGLNKAIVKAKMK